MAQILSGFGQAVLLINRIALNCLIVKLCDISRKVIKEKLLIIKVVNAVFILFLAHILPLP